MLKLFEALMLWRGAQIEFFEGLFAEEDFAEGGELVEGLERGEVVDVEAKELVANLAEDRVVQLEKAELHTVLTLLRHGGDGIGGVA